MLSLDAQKVLHLRFFQTVNEVMVFSVSLVDPAILVSDVTGIIEPRHSRDASLIFKVFEPARVVGEETFSFLVRPWSFSRVLAYCPWL